MDQAMWLIRMGLLTLGGMLTARGVGDAPMWEAVAGAVTTVGTAAWSYAERKKLAGGR